MKMWGNSYYGNDIETDRKSQSALLWVGLLHKNHPDLQEQVSLTVRQWNNTIRDLLRNETGLRLSVGDEITQVQIKVVDGIPLPLIWALSEYDQYAELLLHENNLKSTAKGLGILLDQFKVFASLLGLNPESEHDVECYAGEIKERWVEASLRKFEAFQIEERLRGIDEDILGAYFFQRQRIEIYWASIGIFAARLGVSVEGLTVVILAHELAHAYTHLGKDIDGVVWDTQRFAESDKHTVEGMAQFYTRAICRKLAMRFPAALTAFDALLKLQSEPYTDFERWIPKHPHQGEVVRFSMIQCRSSGERDYRKFLDMLHTQRVTQ